jgi:hypothetical protein
MARKPKVEFEGVLYHVIVRGNHRRNIFRDQSDRGVYLDRMEHYRERYRCIVYRLPVNVQSVHLLIETGGWGFPRSCNKSSSVASCSKGLWVGRGQAVGY